jgi:hypothetical protein
MPLLFIIGLFLPRVIAAILYFFSDRFTNIFETWYWPVLGFIFMPYTLLWYSAVVHWYDGVWAFWQIVGLVVAICMDISSHKKKKSD